MSPDYQDFEYVFGDCSEFCDEDISSGDDLLNSTHSLREQVEDALSSDEKLQLLGRHFASPLIPPESSIDLFLSEFQRRPDGSTSNGSLQTTLREIHKFMTAAQIRSALVARALDVNDPSLLMSALDHVDVEGSRSPDLELVEFLLQQGSDPNATVNGVSPLKWLIRNSSEKCVTAAKLLLSYGARAAQSETSVDPLREAALERRQDMLDAFLEYNQDPQAELEARELLWAVSLADLPVRDSRSLLEKVFRARESCPKQGRTRSHAFHSVDDLIEARAVQQLEAGLGVMLGFFGDIKKPSPSDTAAIQLIVSKFSRAADIRLSSGSEFAKLIQRPLSSGFEFAPFKTRKQADLTFRDFVNLAQTLCRTASFQEATVRANLSQLLRCTLHQGDIRSQLDELSHPDELGAVLCAVTAILGELQRNELWTPQDSEYEERLITCLLDRGAYVRQLGCENRSPMDILTDVPKMPLEIVRLMENSDCCGSASKQVPSLKCQVAISLANGAVTLSDDEIHYRILVRRSSVASLGEFVKAHGGSIKDH